MSSPSPSSASFEDACDPNIKLPPHFWHNAASRFLTLSTIILKYSTVLTSTSSLNSLSSLFSPSGLSLGTSSRSAARASLIFSRRRFSITEWFVLRSCSLALFESGPAGLRPLRRAWGALDAAGGVAARGDGDRRVDRGGLGGDDDDDDEDRVVSFRASSRRRLTLRGGLSMPSWRGLCSSDIVVGGGGWWWWRGVGNRQNLSYFQ